MVVFGKSCFIWANWLYLGKLVVFGQIRCIWANWFYLGKRWKAEILQMAESDIVDVKSGADHDAAIQNWLRPRFVEL